MGRTQKFHNLDPYRPLTLLMQRLPEDMTWTAKERARWMAAFEANLDFLVSISTPLQSTNQQEGN